MLAQNFKGWLRTDRDEKDEYPVWGDFIIFSLCQSRISRIKTFQMNSDIDKFFWDLEA